MYDYSPLWKTLSEKDFSTYRLITEYGLSKGTLDALKHNRNVTMNTIDWLCQVLHVTIEQVVNISMDEIAVNRRFIVPNWKTRLPRKTIHNKVNHSVNKHPSKTRASGFVQQTNRGYVKYYT